MYYVKRCHGNSILIIIIICLVFIITKEYFRFPIIEDICDALAMNAGLKKKRHQLWLQEQSMCIDKH